MDFQLQDLVASANNECSLLSLFDGTDYDKENSIHTMELWSEGFRVFGSLFNGNVSGLSSADGTLDLPSHQNNENFTFDYSINSNTDYNFFYLVAPLYLNRGEYVIGDLIWSPTTDELNPILLMAVNDNNYPSQGFVDLDDGNWVKFWEHIGVNPNFNDLTIQKILDALAQYERLSTYLNTFPFSCDASPSPSPSPSPEEPEEDPLVTCFKSLIGHLCLDCKDVDCRDEKFIAAIKLSMLKFDLDFSDLNIDKTSDYYLSKEQSYRELAKDICKCVDKDKLTTKKGCCD